MKRRSLLKTASYASATLMLQGLAKTANASEGLSVVLDNLHQAPLNTTLLGVMRGVADFYGIEISDATLFGATGHAFIINIHPTLDPSGPYVWDRTHFTRLARNIGLQITNLGFFSPASSLTERQEVEATLGEALDVDIPCSLINLENQLIMGYDETGLLTARPQPQMNFNTAAFDVWELGRARKQVPRQLLCVSQNRAREKDRRGA